MKQKILTLFLALAASVGTMFAEVVKIGDLYYDLDVASKNAYVAPNPNGKYSGDIIIPPTVEDNNSIVYNVKNILKYAFKDCTELTSVTIPNSVTTIYALAFENCTSLTNIIIPEGVTVISDQVFNKCSGLTSVTLPKSLTGIGQFAFSNCTSLTDIIIPEGVTELYSSTFAQCSALTSVTIPSSVTHIMNYAFSGCSNLTGITCQAVVPPTCGEQVFGNVPKTIPVYVPKGSVAAYKAADKWADFGDNIVPIPEEIYAVWDEPNTTLTLYYDDQRIALNGETDWSSYASTATTVVLDASMQDARPTSTAKWFFTFSKMTAIQNLEYLNTSEVTEMSAMFLGCSALTALDLSKFNTENVTNMNGMFYACSSLTSLDLSNFNTAKVEDMSYMFRSCRSQTSLDVSSFNTANVTNMNYMFYYCNLLTSLDLSNFNTAKVTGMSGMFEGCESLKTIYCDDAWNPSSSDNMFYDCTALVGGKGTAYNSDKLDKTYARPDGLGDQPGYFTAKGAGSNEIYAALSGSTMTLYYDDQRIALNGETDWSSYASTATTVVLDASMQDARPTSTAFWFRNFSKVTAIQNLEYLNTSEATEMTAMFLNCSALTALDLSKFNTENVTKMGSMFLGCSELTALDLSKFNTENVTGMMSMFSGCSALTTIYCDDDWSASTALTSSNHMFSGCTALVGGKGTVYDANHTDKTYARPDEGTSTPGYFTKKTATALDKLQNDKAKATKVIENGHLLILHNGKTYDIKGQEAK